MSEYDDEEFYTPGGEPLLQFRRKVTEFSLQRASQRMQLLKDLQTTQLKYLQNRRATNTKYKEYELQGSQMVSSRPVAVVAISDNGYIATGDWDGGIRVYNESLEESSVKESHTDKIGGLDWYNDILCSGGADGTVKIHSAETHSLTGHEGRVTRVKFHPLGNYIASAGFDTTWRLWDTNTMQEIMLQEGHSKEVFTLGFQQDGGLLASAGLDGIGRVWDLRVGRSIMVLDGHVKPIYGLDWSPCGTRICTGGADGTVKIWDLRTVGCEATIPAHNKIVSETKWQGNVVVTASYDSTINVYSTDNWLKVKSLSGHADKVMGVDCNDQRIVSSGWDRTIKLWHPSIDT